MNTDKEMNRIGIRIAEIRREKGWTQEELAGRCGVGRAHIAHIEKGTYNIQLKTLSAIASAFDMVVDFAEKS